MLEIRPCCLAIVWVASIQASVSAPRQSWFVLEGSRTMLTARRAAHRVTLSDNGRNFPNFLQSSHSPTYRRVKVNDMTERILTVREVANMLKLNEKTVYRLAAEARLPGFKVGGSWRFRAEDLDNWIAAEVTKSALSSHGGDPGRGGN